MEIGCGCRSSEYGRYSGKFATTQTVRGTLCAPARLYGHSDLPKAEQEVRFFVWSADLREKRGGSWILPLILVWALDWTSKAQLQPRARCRPGGCNSSCTMLRASLRRPLGLTDLTLSVYIADGSRDSCVPAETGRGIPLEACALASE